MKKYTVLCVALSTAMVLAGCKSKESAYKQAYLKSKMQEEMPQQQAAATGEEANVVVPMVERSAVSTQVMDNADNVVVKQENVQLVQGTGLKAFSVVVSSFKLKANAEGLVSDLKKEGYNAQLVVKNDTDEVMYRVVATTFDTKNEAVASRDALQGKFPGAWLLYAK